MKSLSAIALAITSLLAFSTSASAQLKAPIEINGIAAKVNGRVITRNEVMMSLAPIYATLNAQYPRHGVEFQTQIEKAKDKVLQELIDRQLILDEFSKIGASMPPHAVDEELKRIINSNYNGDKSKFNDELRKSRLTMDGYREMTKQKMIVQAMRAQQFSDAPPPLPNEIQNEYHSSKKEFRDTTQDLISFYKIFIPAGDPRDVSVTRESQLELTEQILKDIKSGKDFAELAKLHSKDAFADQGGHQENVPRSDLSYEFASIIFDAEIGNIIGPLVDAQGFTIVKPTKITYGPTPSLEELRNVMEDRVRIKKTSAQYERWIESRRKRAMITIKI